MKRICLAVIAAVLFTSCESIALGQEEPKNPPPPPPQPKDDGGKKEAPPAVIYLQPAAPQNNWEWTGISFREPWDIPLGHIEVGAGLLIVKPNFEDNPAFASHLPPAPGVPAHQTLAHAFDWTFEVGPTVWLGWKADNGLGVRASYFTLDQISRSITFANPPAGLTSAIINEPASLPDPKSFLLTPAVPPVPPGVTGDFFSPSTIASRALGVGVVSPDSLAFGSSLRFDTLTLEGTDDFTFGPVALTVTGGGRFLYHKQTYGAALVNHVAVAGGARALEVDTLNYRHTFNGGGPTASLYARHLLGETGLSVYGDLRGSILVGKGRQNFIATQLIRDTGIAPPIPPQSTFRIDQFVDNRDDTLPVTEFELGLEYAADFGACRVFLQGAVAAQTYFGAGSATSENGNLSLFGLHIALGVSR